MPETPENGTSAIAPKPRESLDPLICNEQLIAIVFNSLLAGNYLETALGAAGITHAQHYRWIRKARMRNQPPCFKRYAAMVERANHQAEEKLVFTVASATDRSPQLALEMLSRRWPRRWSQRVKEAIDQERDELLARLERNLPPEEYARALEAIVYDPRGTAGLPEPGVRADAHASPTLTSAPPAPVSAAGASPDPSTSSTDASGGAQPEPGVPGSGTDPAGPGSQG